MNNEYRTPGLLEQIIHWERESRFFSLHFFVSIPAANLLLPNQFIIGLQHKATLMQIDVRLGNHESEA